MTTAKQYREYARVARLMAANYREMAQEWPNHEAGSRWHRLIAHARQREYDADWYDNTAEMLEKVDESDAL